MRKAVFLDRDGVLNSVVGPHKYVLKWKDFHFLPGIKGALARLKKLGYLLILVSNQGGIAKGYASLEQIQAINEKMNEELKKAGAGLDAIYICPHRDEDNCDCRKPEIGLFLQAQKDWDIDFSCSFIVGDMLTDIMVAQKLGCMPILVLSPLSPLVALNLVDAAELITNFNIQEDLNS